MPNPVYLVDWAAYKPPEECRLNAIAFKDATRSDAIVNPERVQYWTKMLPRTGLSIDGTYLPAWLNPSHTTDPTSDMATALEEARMVMGGAVAEVLEKTGTKPEEIDILVTNCSIFCPTPSLASMLVNMFKMRTDIESYALGGMGCGNGVVSVGLIKNLLQARPNVTALFVPAEITTYCFYPGEDTDKMISNVLFRMGGAATLFTNKPSALRKAKYQLLHNVRVHTGQDDDSYGCMGWGPDGSKRCLEVGGVNVPTYINGVYLNKTIPKVAAKAVTLCLKQIAPKVMTWSQYAEAAYHLAQQRLGYNVGQYIPDWTQSVDHFALHSGGYGVIKGLMLAMNLPVDKVLPSFATLRDYGNTSCSTTWYTMAYLESTTGVQRGQKVMQIGMGGGMKCGINIWRALRDNNTVHKCWQHRAHNPYTTADMPRPILTEEEEAIAVNGRLPRPTNDAAVFSKAASESAKEAATAAEADGLGSGRAKPAVQEEQLSKPVGGTPPVMVKAAAA